MTTPYQRALTTLVDNIEHLESTTVNGWSIVKIFLQPGASLDTANAQVGQRVAVDAALHAAGHAAAADHQLQRLERADAAARPLRQGAVRAGAERPVVQLPPHPADHRARRGRAAAVRRQAAPGQHQPRSAAAAVEGARAAGRAQRGRPADPDSAVGHRQDRPVRIRRAPARQPADGRRLQRPARSGSPAAHRSTSAMSRTSATASRRRPTSCGRTATAACW